MAVTVLTLVTCAALLAGRVTSAQSPLQVRCATAGPEQSVEGSGADPSRAALLTTGANTPPIQTEESVAVPSGCPPVRYVSLLQCAVSDQCQTDTQCSAGLICCPGGCGRRCRCRVAVCSPGCDAGSRCVWRRHCARRRRCRTLPVCVPAPAAPVCSPPCSSGLGCRHRRYPAEGGVCAPIDLRELHEDATEHDERHDCYETDDDDDDDLFDDDLFEHARYRPSRRQETVEAATGSLPAPASAARQPTNSYGGDPGQFGSRTSARRPVYTFRYGDDDDDDDDDDDFDDDDLFDDDK